MHRQTRPVTRPLPEKVRHRPHRQVLRPILAILVACLATQPSSGGNTRISEDQQSGEYTLTLLQGWNLVSLPIVPDDPDCESVFGADIPADGVLAYNRDTGEYDPVSGVEPMVGYWVYALAQTEVSVQGTVLEQGTVPVAAGWNLCGPCSPTTISGSRGLSTTAWCWDALQQCYMTVDGILDHGVAYWLSYSGTNADIALGEPTQDTDEEGLWDVWERACDADHEKPDTDGDGLTDYEEVFTHGTRAGSSDTDGDGLSDSLEVTHTVDGLDPKNADSDGNGIPDGQDDWDNDGLTTARELELGLDPHHADVGDAVIEFATVNTTTTETGGTLTVRVTLSLLPPYGNTVRAVVEPIGGTATRDEDYECEARVELEFSFRQTEQSFDVEIVADGQLEPTEVIVFSLTEVIGAATGEQSEHRIVIEDALSTEQDTDGDALADAWEEQYFGSLEADPDDDPDGDGITNQREYQMGMHPNAPIQYDDTDALQLRITGAIH